MKNKVIYISLCILFFGIGVYTWKVSHTGRNPVYTSSSSDGSSNQKIRSVLVEVGEKEITNEDLDWEYEFQTLGIFGNDQLTSVSNLGVVDHQQLSPLKKRLIASMIERNLLFEFVKMDKTFILTDTSKFVSCLNELEDTLKTGLKILEDQKNQTRLKKRLCERSLVMQYLREKIYPKIEIPDAEIVEYYKNHTSEFKKPRRVEIRQVVLPDERTARKVRHKLRRHNFAQMAMQHSITPEAEQGGHLGPFAKGEMPSVFDVAFLMGRNQISSILKSTYGFHIIMLTKKLGREELNLDQATPRIRKILMEKKKEEEYQKWVERALSTITVSAPSSMW